MLQTWLGNNSWVWKPRLIWPWKSYIKYLSIQMHINRSLISMHLYRLHIYGTNVLDISHPLLVVACYVPDSITQQQDFWLTKYLGLSICIFPNKICLWVKNCCLRMKEILLNVMSTDMTNRLIFWIFSFFYFHYLILIFIWNNRYTKICCFLI